MLACKKVISLKLVLKRGNVFFLQFIYDHHQQTKDPLPTNPVSLAKNMANESRESDFSSGKNFRKKTVSIQLKFLEVIIEIISFESMFYFRSIQTLNGLKQFQQI